VKVGLRGERKGGHIGRKENIEIITLIAKPPL